jgi:PPIC-type PPIASE domain
MRWLREPLLHFLLLGALLFVIYGRVAPADKAGQRIVVSTALIVDLARQYRTTWMRPPTKQELDGLVEAYVRDEILYREGLVLGLDRDDVVIKRRVRQKLEVMAEEQLAREVPSDAELSAYLSKNAARFTHPAVLSFEQILFANSASVAQVEKVVADARKALARGLNAKNLGKQSMLPQRQEQASLDQVARDFGKAFAEQLMSAPLNQWSGPVISGVGTHLVRVTERLPANLPPLEAVRTQVAREWENEQRERSRTENYRQLHSRYQVVIEPWTSIEVTVQP